MTRGRVTAGTTRSALPPRLSGSLYRLPAGVATLDAGGVVTWTNPAFDALIGRSGASLKGADLAILFENLGAPPAVVADLRDLIAHNHPGTVGVQIRRPGHGAVWFSLGLGPRDDGGKSGFLAVCHDLTPHSDAVQQLAKARGEVEVRDRAKSPQFAMMSHEIRRPLNNILGKARNLIGSGLPGEQRDDAESIRDSGLEILGLINDILDISRVEAGRFDVQEMPFDLRHVVDGVVERLSPQTREKGIELVAAIEPETPVALSGDPGRLRQILLKLIGNAIKFTEHGRIDIGVRATTKSRTWVTLRFEIKDTGAGIAESAQSLLFVPYQAAERDGPNHHDGGGLGLAICRALVEMMGGQIGVRSRVGEGSTFWCSIPFAARGEERSREPWQSPNVEGMRVLVVDDISHDTRELRLQLMQLGVEIFTVHDGAMASFVLTEAATNGTPFDALITDQILPDMTGEEVGRRVRSQQGFAKLPMVLVTSSGMRGDATQAKQAGFGAFLTKPVSDFVLAKCLHALTRGDGEAKSLITAHSIVERSGTPPRLLMAEDGQINQIMAQAILLRAGYLVDTVATGEGAVNAVRETRYDLVLLDLQMPGKDGFEAATEIRRLPGDLGRVPLVALTSFVMDGTREVCFEAGMDDFVAKPFQPDVLLETVERCLEESRTSPDRPEAEEIGQALTAMAENGVGDATHRGSEESVAQIRDAIANNDLDALHEAARAMARIIKEP